MGTVINTKKEGDNVILNLELHYKEALQTKGHLNNIHIFSEDASNMEAHISQRGKNASTKYFLIPRHLRKNIKFNTNVSCQMLDLNEKAVFIYVVEKMNNMNSKKDRDRIAKEMFAEI